MKKIAAVVIIYNPTVDVIKNIETYNKKTDKLYIIDNSERSNYSLFEKVKKAEYIFNNQNIGVASALNLAVDRAYNDGYDWLLTMDQDSYFLNNSLEKMLEKLDVNSNIAIYAPQCIMDNNFKQNDKIVMTSGNIINVSICRKIGKFKEWLFIDGVDHDYCLNVLSNKYKIRVIKSAKIKHNLGNITVRKIGKRRIYTTNHNSFRRYFITRNRLYINEMYKNSFPDFCKNELNNTKKEILKIIMFEKNKIEKIKSIRTAKKHFEQGIKGYPDFLKNKKELNYHIDSYWCDYVSSKLYLRGWAFEKGYKISIIADGEEIFSSSPNEIRMDINTHFSTKNDTNKYGFEYIVDIKKKYKKIKVYLTKTKEKKLLLSDGAVSSKFGKIKIKLTLLIKKTLKVIKTQKLKLLKPSVIKNYFAIINQVLENRKNNNNYIDPNNSFQYRYYIEKSETGNNDKFNYNPLISILVPVYNVPVVYLRECIDSVLKQKYTNWELCIADDCSTDPEIKKFLDEYCSLDNRIKVVYREKNGHISRCTNSALSLATGEFISLLDNDDTLTSDALYEVVKALNNNNDLDLIYSDEDKLDLNNNKCFPAYKPDWSPDTFYCYNYLCHFTTIRKRIIDEIGGFRIGYEGSQDYDLFLRTVEKTTSKGIHHIPKILYHWRMIPGSTAETISNKIYAFERGRKALSEHLKRMGCKCNVGKIDPMPYYYPNYKLNSKIKILIIINNVMSKSSLKRCIKSIINNMEYRNFDIVVNTKLKIKDRYFNDNNIIFGTYDDLNDIILNYDAEYIMVLNESIELVNESKVCEMLRFAAQKHVGIVSGTITKNKNYIQYSGTVLLKDKLRFANAGTTKKHFGYLGKMKLPTNYICPGLDIIVFEKEKYLKITKNNNSTLNNIDNYIKMCIEFLNNDHYNLVLPNCVFITYKTYKKDYINYNSITIERDCFYNDNLSKEYLYKLDK